MRNTPIRRALAAGASVAVAAAGMTALASSASATSAELGYTCEVSFFTGEALTAVVDTNLPDTVEVGSSTPFEVTATVTVPAANTTLLPTLRNLAATVDGNADVEWSVNDAAGPTAALTIPETPVPAEGNPLTIVATGTGGTFAPTTAGAHAIKAGNFSGTLNLKKADGSPALVPTAALACDADADQDLTVDTVNVAEPEPTPTPRGTKTKAKVKVFKKAKRAKATINVVQKGKKQKAARGKVTVVLKKGKKVVAKRTVKLNKKGKRVVTFKKLKKGNYKLVVKYMGTKNLKKSKRIKKFRVR